MSATRDIRAEAGLRLERSSIRALFSRRVGVGVRRLGDDGADALFPEEEALFGPRMAERRREHLRLGRIAAHDALSDLRDAPAAVGRGERGEPLWPDGVVGSISHTGDLAVAVVSAAQHYRGIGVDVELTSAEVSDRAAQLICLPSELRWVNEQPKLRRTQVFAAKEAIFKALYPVERVWLGFGDAEVTWEPSARAFTAKLKRSAGAEFPAGFSFPVGCQVTDEMVFAWVAV